MSLKDELSEEGKGAVRKILSLGIIVGALFAAASFHDCIGWFNGRYESKEQVREQIKKQVGEKIYDVRLNEVEPNLELNNYRLQNYFPQENYNFLLNFQPK